MDKKTFARKPLIGTFSILELMGLLLLAAIGFGLFVAHARAAIVSPDFSQNGTVIDSYFGTNTGPWPLSTGCRVNKPGTASGTENATCDWAQERAWMLESGLRVNRQDVDFKSNTNNVTAGAPFNTTDFTTFNQSNFASAPLQRIQVGWQYNNSIIPFFDALTTPNWNAHNPSNLCTRPSNNATCPSLNLTQTKFLTLAWLNYVNASQGETWVGTRNEPYAVSPPFFLDNWSYVDRCAAVNQSRLVSFIVNETNASWQGVDLYTAANPTARIRKIFPGPYTFENSTTPQESCEWNVTIATARALAPSHPDMWMQIHDYYNNGETDAASSYAWQVQRQTARAEFCAAVPAMNCSRIINGEFNSYDNTTMWNDGDEYENINTGPLLYATQYAHSAENWTLLNFKWTTTGAKTYEGSGGTARVYNMVFDPVVSGGNTTTRAFKAFALMSMLHYRGKTPVYAPSNDADIEGTCTWVNNTQHRCTIMNIGSAAETVNVSVSGLGLYNVTAATNSYNATSYSVVTATGGGNIIIGNMPRYNVVHLNLTVSATSAVCPTSGPIVAIAGGLYYNGDLNCPVAASYATPTNITCLAASDPQNRTPLDDWSGNEKNLNAINNPTYNNTGFYSFLGTPTNINAQGLIVNLTGSYNFSFAEPFAVSLNVKRNGEMSTSDTDIITQWGTVSSIGYPFAVRWSNSTRGYIVRMYNGSASAISTASTVNDTDWHHILMIYNSTHMLFYRDGSLVSTGAITLGGSITTGENISIGRRTGATSVPFNGSIDNVQIYGNRTLSSSDISTLYNNGTLNSGLKAYYPFINQTGLYCTGNYTGVKQVCESVATRPNMNPLNDSSGNENTLRNAGGAIHNTSSNSYYFTNNNALVGKVLSFNDNFTILASLMPYSNGSAGNSMRALSTQPSGATPSGGFAIIKASNGATTCSLVNITGNGFTLTSNRTIPLNAWSNVVCTFRRNSATQMYGELYVDGVITSNTTATLPGQLFNTTYNFTIGTATNSFGYWNGSVANVILLNRTANSSEVAELSANRSVSNMIAWYQMMNQTTCYTPQ